MAQRKAHVRYTKDKYGSQKTVRVKNTTTKPRKKKK
jgi:hypothetical protein